MSMSSSTCSSKFAMGLEVTFGSALLYKTVKWGRPSGIQAVFIPGFSRGRRFLVLRLWRFEKPLATFLPASIGFAGNCLFLKDRIQFLPHIFVFYFFLRCCLWCHGPNWFGDLKYDNISFILYGCRRMCALDKKFPDDCTVTLWRA